jgi:hypothetical protein
MADAPELDNRKTSRPTAVKIGIKCSAAGQWELWCKTRTRVAKSWKKSANVKEVRSSALGDGQYANMNRM